MISGKFLHFRKAVQKRLKPVSAKAVVVLIIPWYLPVGPVVEQKDNERNVHVP